MILRLTDKLSQTLQSLNLSSVEGHEVAMLTVKTLKDMRSDRDFSLFYEKFELRRCEWEIEEPQLPRKRKAPKRLELGTGEGSFPSTVIDLYRQTYFEVLDLTTSCITDRFDQEGFRIYSNVEQLLFKAASGKTYENELSIVCDFYQKDFVRDDLESQLMVFKTLHGENTKEYVHVLKC